MEERVIFFFNSGGEVNDKLPKTITETLGPTTEQIQEQNQRDNRVDQKKIEEINQQLENRTDGK